MFYYLQGTNPFTKHYTKYVLTYSEYALEIISFKYVIKLDFTRIKTKLEEKMKEIDVIPTRTKCHINSDLLLQKHMLELTCITTLSTNNLFLLMLHNLSDV